MMEIIPAIDIRGGRCVRLYQGDYNRETVYAEDPVQVALKWQAEGATHIHVVDLDGAAAGEPRNLPVVAAMARAVRVPIELGGGIRTWESVEKVLSLGIQRVILGTVAVEHPDLAGDLCRRFGEGIVAGIDARDGKVAVRGWLEGTGMSVIELARKMAGLGVKRIIYTDIARDGTLTQPNFAAVESLVKSVPVAVIASGGVATVAHLKALSKTGAEAAIVGKALYTRDVKLKEAIAALRGTGFAQ